MATEPQEGPGLTGEEDMKDGDDRTNIVPASKDNSLVGKKVSDNIIPKDDQNVNEALNNTEPDSNEASEDSQKERIDEVSSHTDDCLGNHLEANEAGEKDSSNNGGHTVGSSGEPGEVTSTSLENVSKSGDVDRESEDEKCRVESSTSNELVADNDNEVVDTQSIKSSHSDTEQCNSVDDATSHIDSNSLEIQDKKNSNEIITEHGSYDTGKGLEDKVDNLLNSEKTENISDSISSSLNEPESSAEAKEADKMAHNEKVLIQEKGENNVSINKSVDEISKEETSHSKELVSIPDANHDKNMIDVPKNKSLDVKSEKSSNHLAEETNDNVNVPDTDNDKNTLDLNEPLGGDDTAVENSVPGISQSRIKSDVGDKDIKSQDEDSEAEEGEEEEEEEGEEEEEEVEEEEEEEGEEEEGEEGEAMDTDEGEEVKVSEEPDSTKLVAEDVEMKSDASLEEVSEDEEGELGEIVDEPNLGMEEVSESGEIVDDKMDGENSGIEEVSDEEDDMDEIVKKDGKAAESGVEEVSEEEDEEITATKNATEGVEDVSSEEEEIEEEEEEEVEASEEEEEEEEGDDNEDDDAEKTVDKERTVEVTQNGEVVTYDDTGKDDSVVVKEILETMTIKIENKNQPQKQILEKRSKSSDKKKKERRESAKSKSSSASHKAFKDINERLKAQASYGGEDVELDYDDVHEEAKDKHGTDGELSSDSESDEGELEEEEDCEEGEIREEGSKPFVKPTCRFFMRGHCTWGTNCRFLHPGVNDKGNYQLIERPGFNNKSQNQFNDQWEEQQERSPSPEPSPPRAPTPKEETAWERGLRQAKELRKKASERRELDSNFEHKKFNLSIDDNPEYNKENTIDTERTAVKKYYEKLEPLSDDEYYDQTPVRLQQKQMEQSWMHGDYENFEVRWSRDAQYGIGAPPPGYPGHPASRDPRYPPERPYRAPPDRYTSPTLRPSPRRFSPSPPAQYHNRYVAPREANVELRREKLREKQRSPSPVKRSNHSPQRAIKADEWHDPWRRSNVNRPTSPVKRRSRSRGRRRSKRSHSYSSYSSSSYSSGSRSSSYSSGSSRSRSRSRSSSISSRSPPRHQAGERKRRPPGHHIPPGRRPNNHPRMGDPPKNALPFHGGRPDRSPIKRANHPSPTKGPKGVPQGRGPPDGRFPHPGHGGPGRGGGGRKPERPLRPSPPPQRKFSMKVDTKDRPLPPSALSKERKKGRRATSSTSRSSSSSSRSSSFSSRSSRSSSSSSSGSADSEHLYRNIGGREKPPGPKNRGDKPQRQNPSPNKRHMPMKPSGRPAQIGSGAPPKPKDPLKMTGQKSNIKLTLIKPNEKPPPSGAGVGKKRTAEMSVDGPAAKRPNIAPPPAKQQEKPMKRPDRPDRPDRLERPDRLDRPERMERLERPDRPAQAPPIKVAPQRPPVPAVPKPVGPPAVAAPAIIKKKSTVSRREELLKQLKAVEDAIAKKKKKMV